MKKLLLLAPLGALMACGPPSHCICDSNWDHFDSQALEKIARSLDEMNRRENKAFHKGLEEASLDLDCDSYEVYPNGSILCWKDHESYQNTYSR